MDKLDELIEFHENKIKEHTLKLNKVLKLKNEPSETVEGMYNDSEGGFIDPQFIIDNFGKSKK